MPKALPARPDLDWLKKTAKERLTSLRAADPEAKLHQAQLLLARDYGFASWRALKSHLDAATPRRAEQKRVFAAARAGDVAAVRQAFAAGFDPGTLDEHGRSLHQIAKDEGLDAIELLVREVQGGERRPQEVVEAARGLADAAQKGERALLRERLDAHPELIDALSGGFQKWAPLHAAAARSRHECLRLLIERGADLGRRDFPDNATPLHLAAALADLETVGILVEAGADVVGEGDDYAVGVLGWATCFQRLREDIAAYLLAHGAPLTLWTAIALDRAEAFEGLIARDPSLLEARMTRNQHRRTPLHHAAAKNRRRIVRLLLSLGADPNAADATGATPLTTAAQAKADAALIGDLIAAGARLDLLTALNLGRYDAAEAMLREDPARLGPAGSDTVALHLAVSRKELDVIRWLIAHGVDVSAKRMIWGCNHTALHMAIENGALEIAEMLLAAGADPNIRDDKYGATALGWAQFFGRPAFAALLREKGGVR